jgi:integrase
MRRVLVLGFLCGLRLGEILEARRRWIDRQSMAIHVPNRQPLGDIPGEWRTKDLDGRNVPLTRQALKLLGQLPTDPEAYLIAPGVGHGRWRYRWDPRRPWRQFVAAQGVPDLTPHVMRHTFASLLVQRGVSLYKVARWLGDGLRVVDSHYAHLSPGDRDIEALHDSP